MLVKFVSLVTLICAIAIASVNIQNSSDPLFFIVAGGIGADLIRIVLAGGMVAAAFLPLPKRIHPEVSVLLLGILLISFGITGFVMNSFDYVLYNYVKPLDFLMLSEAGIVTSLAALETNKQMVHFYDPYRRTFTIAFLPKLKKVKTAAA
jgi:hypothetical protein